MFHTLTLLNATHTQSHSFLSLLSVFLITDSFNLSLTLTLILFLIIILSHLSYRVVYCNMEDNRSLQKALACAIGRPLSHWKRYRYVNFEHFLKRKRSNYQVAAHTTDKTKEKKKKEENSKTILQSLLCSPFMKIIRNKTFCSSKGTVFILKQGRALCLIIPTTVLNHSHVTRT